MIKLDFKPKHKAFDPSSKKPPLHGQVLFVNVLCVDGGQVMQFVEVPVQVPQV